MIILLDWYINSIQYILINNKNSIYIEFLLFK